MPIDRRIPRSALSLAVAQALGAAAGPRPRAARARAGERRPSSRPSIVTAHAPRAGHPRRARTTSRSVSGDEIALRQMLRHAGTAARDRGRDDGGSRPAQRGRRERHPHPRPQRGQRGARRLRGFRGLDGLDLRQRHADLRELPAEGHPARRGAARAAGHALRLRLARRHGALRDEPAGARRVQRRTSAARCPRVEGSDGIGAAGRPHAQHAAWARRSRCASTCRWRTTRASPTT